MIWDAYKILNVLCICHTEYFWFSKEHDAPEYSVNPESFGKGEELAVFPLPYTQTLATEPQLPTLGNLTGLEHLGCVLIRPLRKLRPMKNPM